MIWYRSPAVRSSPCCRRLTFGALAYLAAFVAWVYVGAGSERERAVIADAAFLPVSLVAAFVALRSTAGAGGGDRVARCWRWIAAGLGCVWVGDVLWFVYEVVLDTSPFPSLADAAYLAFYPCLVVGLLALPARPSVGARRMLALDAATVVLGGAMVVWYLVIEPTLRQGDQSALVVALSLAFPVGDLLLLFAVGVVLIRRVEVARRVIWLLVIAVALFVASDIAYAHASLLGEYRSGSWTDAGWMAAQVLTALAAVFQHGGHLGRGDVGPRPDRGLLSALPYSAVVSSYALVVLVGGREVSDGLLGLLVGTGFMTVLVLSRQLAASRENARLFAEVHRLAVTDPLTGLNTRRALLDSAEQEVRVAARTRTPVSMMMIDIDHFKHVNDSLGHAVGDLVLTAVGRRCRDSVRETDLLARYGGDEMTAVLPGLSAYEAFVVAERFRAAVDALPIDTEAGAVPVTVSVGLATVTGGASLDDLLVRADKALYDAKQAGRNCVRAFADEPVPLPASQPAKHGSAVI